ncbi:hypothetical protein ACFCYB_28125 [Streptomyces sp. NPDC056309]|uniref:hypothetical protein n=1 Tax=unclassified Streptomyces TaxID=2593676 RepID=UPI0035D81BA6
MLPVQWHRLGHYGARDAAGRRIRTMLSNSARYLIGPWHEATYPGYASDGYLDLGGVEEANIRYPAMTALTVATALQLDVYQASSLPATRARTRLLDLIRTIAARHRSNNTDLASAWGSVWQSALWAYYNGAAAWLMWDKLAARERAHVVNMVVSEAQRLTTGDDIYLVGRDGYQLYMTSRDGTAVSPGDTKAEEDSWSAELLGLAAAMMPHHPDAPTWRRRNIELLLASAACPNDLTDNRTINGITPSTWLQGTNIADDGTLENHFLLHPIYMVAFDQNLYQGYAFGLAGQAAPAAALRNIDRVYHALVEKEFKTSDNSTRTIYTPGSADIYYPQGNDWGTDFPFYFGNFDLLVSLTGQDHSVSKKAASWEELHNDAQLALMSRFTDGRTYGAEGENTYRGREMRVGVMAAQAYLTLFLTRNDTGNRIRWDRDTDGSSISWL